MKRTPTGWQVEYEHNGWRIVWEQTVINGCNVGDRTFVERDGQVLWDMPGHQILRAKKAIDNRVPWDWRRYEQRSKAYSLYRDALTYFSLEQSFTAAQLARVWKVMARKLHPDVGGSGEEMKRCNAMRDVLSEWLESQG